MGDLNVVTILGRLTRDVELKQTNGGTVARFSLANGYRKKQGSEYVEATNFIDCVAFGKTGEAIQKYVSKGQRL
jgi:Single-stranded DNA-binding protein